MRIADRDIKDAYPRCFWASQTEHLGVNLGILGDDNTAPPHILYIDCTELLGHPERQCNNIITLACMSRFTPRCTLVLTGNLRKSA